MLQHHSQPTPPKIAGAGYYRFKRNADGSPVLATLTGRQPKNLERNSATYDEIVKADRTGFDGIAVCMAERAVEFWDYPGAGSQQGAHQPAPPVPRAVADSRRVPTADDFADLPSQMVQAKRWLVRKADKQPFYVNGKPRSGQLDGLADMASLATFEDALSALQSGQYAGLGFALGPDGTGNCWQGIDLDDLPSRPELQHLADSLPGYTEQSPSGKGVHAIGYGRAFHALGSNGTGIEAYSSGRYFTVTAAGAGLHDPCDLSDFIEAQLRHAHGRGKVQPSATDIERTETVEAKTVTELRSALLAMSADDRDVWIRMGHALKPLGSVGRGLWMEWSATSEKFESADAGRVWRSLNPTNTGYQAVFAEAQRHGWVNPLSNAATGGTRTDWRPPAYARQAVLAVNLDECVVDLDEVVSPDSMHPHVVDRLVPQGEVTLFAGHGAAGKSYIALLVCILVALGRPFGTLATQRTRVLFFSAEDDKAELQRRTAKICRVLEVKQSELKGWLHLMDVSEVDPTLFRAAEMSPADQPTKMLERLAAFVQANGIGLTIIDNASDVFDGNEIVRTQVRAFIRAIRARLARPNRAVVLLAHVSKAAAHNRRGSGADTTEDYSGSTAWHNSVRSRLSLDTGDKGESTLAHLKANKGPKAEPIRLEWHDGTPTVAGTYDPPGAALFESMRRTAERDRDESDKTALVELIHDFDRRGERITTSMQGPYTVYKTLSGSPGFPTGMTSERLNRLMRDLEREGRVFRSQQYIGRKWRDCFTCSWAVVESAPNPATTTQGDNVGAVA